VRLNTVTSKEIKTKDHYCKVNNIAVTAEGLQLESQDRVQLMPE